MITILGNLTREFSERLRHANEEIGVARIAARPTASRLRLRPRLFRRLERHIQLDIEAGRPELDLGLAAEIVADALVDQLHAEAAAALGRNADGGCPAPPR